MFCVKFWRKNTFYLVHEVDHLKYCPSNFFDIDQRKRIDQQLLDPVYLAKY